MSSTFGESIAQSCWDLRARSIAVHMWLDGIYRNTAHLKPGVDRRKLHIRMVFSLWQLAVRVVF